jgi:hypothetical protein
MDCSSAIEAMPFREINSATAATTTPAAPS